MTLELDTTLDLANWPDVLSWAAEASARGHSQLDIATAFLSQGSALGNIRAFTHLMRDPSFTKERGLSILKEAYTTTTDQLVKIIVLVTAHHTGARESLHSGERNEKTNKSGMQILQEYLRDVQGMGRIGMLPLEAEYRIFHAMLVTALTLNASQDVQQLISRLMGIAEIIGHKELTNRTTDFCTTALVSTSNYSESIALGRPQLQKPLVPGMQSSYVGVIVDMANAFLHIGAYKKSRQFLQEGLEKIPNSSSLLGYFQWIEAQSGHLSQTEELPKNWDRVARYGWQIEAFRELSRALAEGPHRAHHRRQHFLRIVEITNEGVDTRLSHDSTVERWLRARARLGLGEYSLARSELSRGEPCRPEDLLHRAWTNALHLELGMTVLPQLLKPMQELEEEARRIYADLQKIEHADPEGLTQLTARWMPAAVAYLGLMPDAIPDCRKALENVFRIKDHKSRWSMTVLPPALALSLTLDALGQEYQPGFSTNTNYQLRPLKQKVGDAEVWGPVVAPVTLALGLLRGGYLDAAREWLSVTRMAPEARGDLGEIAENIQVSFKQAAQGVLSFHQLLQRLEVLMV